MVHSIGTHRRYFVILPFLTDYWYEIVNKKVRKRGFHFKSTERKPFSGTTKLSSSCSSSSRS